MLLLITTIRRSSTSNHKPSRSVPQTAFLGIDRFDVPNFLGRGLLDNHRLVLEVA